MKRILFSSFAVLTVILVALALTGCSSNDSGSGGSSMPSSMPGMSH